MAVFDLTMNNYKFVGTDGFSRNYGTKKTRQQNGGSLTSTELNENMAMIFDILRPIEVTENSSTGNIERNAVFTITTANVVLTLGSGTYAGVEVKIIASADCQIVINSLSSDIYSGSVYNLMYDGTRWRFTDGRHTGDIVAHGSDNIPAGYLLCDGSEISETDYPELYAEIGDMYKPESEDKTTGLFFLPDFRECVLVGAGQNTENTIAAHDVYTVGQFKDDQFQGHEHKAHNAFELAVAAGSNNRSIVGNTNGIVTDGTHGTPRIGTTTHGKQMGVSYIIKY